MPTNPARTPSPGCARPLVSAGRSPSGADGALSSGDGPEATGAKKAEARTLPRCAGPLPWGSAALAEVYAQDGAPSELLRDDGQRKRPPSPRVRLAALAPQRLRAPGGRGSHPVRFRSAFLSRRSGGQEEPLGPVRLAPGLRSMSLPVSMWPLTSFRAESYCSLILRDLTPRHLLPEPRGCGDHGPRHPQVAGHCP